jgi:hypothetical protein
MFWAGSIVQAMKRLSETLVFGARLVHTYRTPTTHDAFLSGSKSGDVVETKSRGYEAA